jgi:anaerobic C4-dicarboxylate transporter
MELILNNDILWAGAIVASALAITGNPISAVIVFYLTLVMS